MIDKEPKKFSYVFKEELREIHRRRQWHAQGLDDDNAESVSECSPENLTGLALSGGGIRSATFCLGLLQGMSSLNLLRCFDYLSTVSGGGYIGGWWSAWLSRDHRATGEIFPPDENGELSRSEEDYLNRRMAKRHKDKDLQAEDSGEIDKAPSESSINSDTDPVHHLRLFANYLTPRQGLLGRDMWRATTFIIRNLVLTWLVLLPILLAIVLLAQLYFVLSPAISRNTSFPHPSVYELIHNQGSSLFRVDDLIDPASLAVKLRDAQIPLSQYLQGRLTSETQQQLKQYDGSYPLAESLHSGLVDELNQILKGSSLFDEQRFAQVILPEKIRSLIEQKPSGEELIRLNRLLLEEAYPHEIAKSPNIATGLFHQPSPSDALGPRMLSVAKPIIALLILICYLSVLWVVRNQSGSLWLRISSLTALIVVVVLVALTFMPVKIFIPFLPVPVLAVVLFPIGMMIQWAWVKVMRGHPAGMRSSKGTSLKPDRATEMQERKEVYRNQLARLQARLLTMTVLISVVLTLSGFGHEIIEYIFFVPVGSSGTPWMTFLSYVAKSLSLSTILGAVGGLIYTWIKATPKGGGDQRESDKTTAMTRLIFAFTPVLVLLTLILIIAWVAHYLLIDVISIASTQTIGPLTVITGIGIILSFIFAVVEMEWKVLRPTNGKLLLGGALLLTAFVGLLLSSLIDFNSASNRNWALRAVVIGAGLILIKIVLNRIKRTINSQDGWLYRLEIFSLLAVCCLVVALCWAIPFTNLTTSSPDVSILRYSLVGIICCAFFYLFILFELLRGERENTLSFCLVNSIYIILSALLLTSSFSPSDRIPVLAAIVLIATALAWVITIGWMVDPNALSMHSFYRSRLVRAYLGASNRVRKLSDKEITESVEGDDLLLKNLHDYRQGSPYHLINTTLNLAGSRDLATAQRSSANFIFSKKYCGSLRTGYRRTESYMNGEMSLGTAIAISGAAVSPNMGALKTSSSLAMLLTLLNVRLGYWAPTPNRDRWQSAQARLWPYYTLLEFLSETNDLSSYCYLTDGGHFDNTGLYSLVQRGCRYIVVADCGADPAPCFRDLGDAIRRCRIDFGAEIDLDITSFIKERDQKAARHYLVGSIDYSETHVEKLGWTDKSEAARRGVVILFKPSITVGDGADIQQYGIENPAFPHQTTADQWFDESQFESYRRLGQSTIYEAFSGLKALNKLKGNATPSQYDIKAIFDDVIERVMEAKKPLSAANDSIQ